MLADLPRGTSSGEGIRVCRKSSLAREIAREQAFVDRVYVQLREVRHAPPSSWPARATSRGKLGHEGGLVERDAMVFQAAQRIAQLDAAHEGLVFGRLDLRAELDTEPRYIGRIGLRDDDRDSLLIDWRAPAAAVFYQATAAEPAERRTPPGAALRRPARSSASRTSCSTPRPTTDLPIVGEGALMAQLSRARDRSMHSIVATIQAEQDQAIRAPGKGVVVDLRRPRHRQDGRRAAPRGVPALHRPPPLRGRRRARRRPERRVHALHRAGAAVSLGETAVALRSLGEVVDGVRATRHDEPAVADVKGSARMAELMRRTARQQAPGQPARVPDLLARRRDPARPRRSSAGCAAS